jgi:hypothetical protein
MTITSREPRITAIIDGRPVSLLMDTGATFFCLAGVLGTYQAFFNLHSRGGGNTHPAINDWLKPIISELLTKGLLRPTHSLYNTPILPVKKPNGSYLLVQDLCLINAAVTPIYLVVPNSYTLLSLIPGTTTISQSCT